MVSPLLGEARIRNPPGRQSMSDSPLRPGCGSPSHENNGSGPRRGRIREHRQQLAEVDRLGEMEIEARLVRLAPIRRLSPAGDGDQPDGLAGGMRAEATRDLV